MKIKKQTMPEQKPEIRINNFEEVCLGFDETTAKLEAERCLQCKDPQCVKGCPIAIKIPEFIKLITENKINDAVKKIKETNPLPGICGRVCPQESQCENLCILNKKFKPVSIGRLERFVADYERKSLSQKTLTNIKSNGIKVAIVGSGPAGLVAASELRKLGYEVTIFEAFHKSGGVLVYGIPEFRLPNKIVEYEIENLKKMGVKIEKNFVIGKTILIEELMNEYNFKAIFIGSGAGLPRFMNIPGENCLGVYSANEFLTRINLMEAWKHEFDTPFQDFKKAVIIGGGNVAMDAARVAKRLKSEVTIIYRRTINEMPARNEEIHHAQEEGIQILELTNPIRYIINDKGWLEKIECLKMELGEPDSSGRRRPIPIKNSNFFIDTDISVVSIGSNPNPLITGLTPNLKTNRGLIQVDENTFMTSIPGVFAGGDCISGAATVVLAAGAGRKAAKEINKYLRKLYIE